jgi:hypothetical protein
LFTANQRARASATELGDLLATGLNWTRAKGGNTAAQRVQDVDWQLPSRFGREVGEGSAGGILGKSFNLCHKVRMFLSRTIYLV